MSKKIRFLNSKLTLERIDCETLLFEALKYLRQCFHMGIPILGENTNVVNVDLDVFDSLEGLLHHLLRNIRTNRYTHR